MPSIARFLCCTVSAGSTLLAAGTAYASTQANDFPTADRVLYVQECMRTNPGSYYEMVNKCSCALDTLAREVTFDDYTSMVTATNANSIGGERGNAIRDAESLQIEIKRLRELQSKVKKSCFINPEAR